MSQTDVVARGTRSADLSWSPSRARIQLQLKQPCFCRSAVRLQQKSGFGFGISDDDAAYVMRTEHVYCMVVADLQAISLSESVGCVKVRHVS